jgi:phosphopantetheinyl transferase (holo-ACP synthase)
VSPRARGAAAAVAIDERAVAAGRELLTPLERAYCLGRRRPAQHVAGRLAAKRAVVALLARTGHGGLDPGAVEVVPGPPRFPVALGWGPWGISRRPVCRTAARHPGLVAALAGVRVSISHSGDVAMAAAVAFRR